MTIRRLTLLCALIAFPAPAAHAQDAATIAKGKEVYEYWCTPCHGKGSEGRGRGYPGTMALEAKYKGAIPAALEDRTDLTPSAIRLAVRRGVSIMPFFRPTEVSDADLEASIAYLRRPRPPTATEGRER